MSGVLGYPWRMSYGNRVPRALTPPGLPAAGLCLVIVLGLHAALIYVLAGANRWSKVAPTPIEVRLMSPPRVVPNPPPPVVEQSMPVKPAQRRAQIQATRARPALPAAPPVASTPAPQPSLSAAAPSATETRAPPAPAITPPPVAEAVATNPSAETPRALSPGQSQSPAQPAPALSAPRFDVAYLDNPRPQYPRMARRLNEQGRVVLGVYVTPEGTPQSVEVRASSGYPRLDRAAREAVAKWRFVPARQGEQAVGAWVLVPITFVLEG
jgi:periplasmic protein TonB